MSKLNFYERAEKLGHSKELLKSGNKISTTISVSNIDELKKLLDDGSSSDKRAEKEILLFGQIPIVDESDVSDRTIMRRVNAYVHGNRELADSDRKIITGAFPINVQAVSAADIIYDVPTELGTSQPLIILNYGTVTINDGACVNVRNSQLQYTMDTLIRNGMPPSGFGDFNILGVSGIKGAAVGTGTNQGKADNGSEGNCSSCGIASDKGGPGTPGAPGGPGPEGNPGFDGLPSKPAVFTITTEVQSASKVIFYSMSGPGGQGGTGGTGGKGGDGGNGGKGATCSATGSAGGNGAAGGPGGDGGPGGPGGNGVDAADGGIVINVAAASLDKIAQATSEALAGEGGDGGTGGAGGTGGTGGSGGPSNPGGSNGSDGGDGSDGTRGVNGTQTGKAAVPVIKPL